MQELKDKLAAATKAFEKAHKRLDEAREAYMHGPGKRYAEALAMEGKLASLTAGHQSSSVSAGEALEKAMRESSGEVTQAVKAALTGKRNAEDLIEQSEMLIRKGERNRTAALIDASKAAREYISTYERAAREWAEMKVFDALVDCGERIARAMAVVPVSGRLIPYPIRSNEHETVCMRLVFDELKTLRASFEGEERAYTRDIGKVDLGALEISDILNPVEVMKLTRSLAGTQT